MLVIHGTEDEVIDFSHGVAIYERCPRPVDPLWVEVSFKLHYFSNHMGLYIVTEHDVLSTWHKML